MSEMIDAVLEALKRQMPGKEIECDRAYVTDDAVFVRANGVWTELKPLKESPFIAVPVHRGK